LTFALGGVFAVAGLVARRIKWTYPVVLGAVMVAAGGIGLYPFGYLPTSAFLIAALALGAALGIGLGVIGVGAWLLRAWPQPERRWWVAVATGIACFVFVNINVLLGMPERQYGRASVEDLAQLAADTRTNWTDGSVVLVNREACLALALELRDITPIGGQEKALDDPFGIEATWADNFLCAPPDADASWVDRALTLARKNGGHLFVAQSPSGAVPAWDEALADADSNNYGTAIRRIIWGG
jgi:hypothetical protein